MAQGSDFYILLKVHNRVIQDTLLLHLIAIPLNACPTSSNLHFVELHFDFDSTSTSLNLQPLVHKLPSFVKLLTIGNLPANSLLVTLDVSSLYTYIPHNYEIINACEHVLRISSHNTIPTGTLCDLIRMILTMNNFLLMITTIFKSTALQCVLNWPPLILTFFWFIWKPTLWKMPHFNLTFGYDISMIFL